MLSALNYQQNQLIGKQQTNTDLLILESNPDYFGDAGFLSSPFWVPHVLDVWQLDVFASKWPLPNGTWPWTRSIALASFNLWTVVNRGERNITGAMRVSDLAGHLCVINGTSRPTVADPLEK